MGKNKCIIFVRVSTDRQATDEQTVRLRALAEADGFSVEDQFLIDYKESGIRLKEEERLGLTEMKELITGNPDITSVYAFEISRIARTKKVLFSIEEFLVSRKIQLIIAEPAIRLLNPDGSINDAADFSFTLFAQYAESEMRLRKERFKNGAERAKKMGHWHGGRCLFGFRIEDKRMVPDEENAFIVRRIFEMYAGGESQSYIAQYLHEFGLKTKGYNLFKLLNNPKYVELVGQELFDSVQTLKATKKSVNRKFRLYAPGEQLIRCPKCGRHYVHITNCYICLGRIKPQNDCDEGFSIRDTYMDAFLLISAKYTYAARLHAEKKDDEERFRQILDEIPRKIEAQNLIRRKMENKKKHFIELYSEEIIDRTEFDKRLREIEKQIGKSDEFCSELIRQQTAIKTSLDDILSGKSVVDASLASLKDASRRDFFELIHKEVQEVRPYREGKYKVFEVKMKAGFSNFFRTSGQGLGFRAEMKVSELLWEDITDLSFLD